MDTDKMKEEAVNVEYRVNETTFEANEEKEVLKENEYKPLQLTLEFITFMVAIVCVSKIITTILEKVL
jgi:hypothetical protein